MFRWQNLSSGVVHGGAFLSMDTTCGVRVGPIDDTPARHQRWKAVGDTLEISCLNCKNVLMTDAQRAVRREFRRELKEMQESPDSRIFALTHEREKLLRTLTVHRDSINLVVDDAVKLAQESGKEVHVRAHNQWWAPSYTAYPDGRVWYHATGRKNGLIRNAR